MKIVQAFNQQGRETVALRRRRRARVRHRQAAHPAARDHDRDRHLPDVRRDHHGHLAGRDRRRRGPDERRHDRRLRALRRPARRRVRQPCPKSMATCCAPPARPSAWPSCSRPSPTSARPAEPARAARAGARRARVRACHLPLSDAARDLGAQRFQPRASGRASGWRWSARRAPARRPSSSSPSASTIRSRAASCSTASTCSDADPADVRQRIAMVPQETVIFAASARDNLRYGNWDASEDAAVAGGARRQCRGVPARASRRARHLHGRRRRAPVGRPAPAHRDRPRAAARRAACCCSTKRPRRSTPKASGWCRTRSTG